MPNELDVTPGQVRILGVLTIGGVPVLGGYMPIDGEDGEEGPLGPVGLRGPIGPTGATGATGATGLPGPPGWAGEDGEDGQPGPSISFPYKAGSGITLTGYTFSIAASAITNSMLAGSIAASKLIGTDIATVGTITAGTWHGTAIGVAYGGTGTGTAGIGALNAITSQSYSGFSGTGNLAGTTSPTFTTPALGAASATSVTFGGTALANYVESTWIPTDASGASLTLTVNHAYYTRIGRIVVVYFDVTYPVTADGSAAKLGGLPLSTLASTYFTGTVDTGVVATLGVIEGSDVALVNAATNAGVTNASLSTMEIVGTITYFT